MFSRAIKSRLFGIEKYQIFCLLSFFVRSRRSFCCLEQNRRRKKAEKTFPASNYGEWTINQVFSLAYFSKRRTSKEVDGRIKENSLSSGFVVAASQFRWTIQLAADINQITNIFKLFGFTSWWFLSVMTVAARNYLASIPFKEIMVGLSVSGGATSRNRFFLLLVRVSLV